MSELFEKSIRVLELPRLLEMLERHAVSAEAKARARSLTPSDDFGEVNRLLDETDAARKMIALRGSPSFGGVRPVACHKTAALSLEYLQPSSSRPGICDAHHAWR